MYLKLIIELILSRQSIHFDFYFTPDFIDYRENNRNNNAEYENRKVNVRKV